MERKIRLVVLAISFCLMLPCIVHAHCDTMDGLVVKDAKAALKAGNVLPTLKWVKPEKETAVCEAFNKALAEKAKGPQEKTMAEQAFFETLVKAHRESEGQPFTGIKPAAAIPNLALLEADLSIESGSAETLTRFITDKISEEIKTRLADAAEKFKHKDESIDAGREFVKAYVTFIHYVEKISEAAENKAAPNQGEAAKK